MIKSWASKEAQKVFEKTMSTKLPRDIQQTALRKLRYLDSAEELKDLRIPPANKLEMLKGDRAGRYSIRINDQWQICFIWEDGDAYEVEIVDYH